MHYVFDAVWYFQKVDWMGLTFYFGSLAGLVSSYDIATPTKEIQWLGSVFTGIFFCVVVSKMSFSSIFQCLLCCKCLLLCLYCPN